MNQRISIKDVDISVAGRIIGGAEEIGFTVTRDNEFAYEAGNYFPVEIVEGKVGIAGTMSRAFIDVELLNTIMPNSSLQTPIDISATSRTGKTPVRSIKLFGCKFNSIDVNGLGLDSYGKNALAFQALSYRLDQE